MPSTRSEQSWIPDVVVVCWNTSWIGKVTAQRRGHGFPRMTFWIQRSWRISTLASLIDLHPEPEVDHHAVGSLGPLEWAVERGVMLQIGQAPPPIHHSDHYHLSTNSSHLHLISTNHHSTTKAHTSLQSVVRSRLHEVDSPSYVLLLT